MGIKSTIWDEDIAYLSRVKNLLTTMKVFTQALIHSNLFDANVNQHGDLKDLTLAEMASKNHKKPFVCAIIEGICFLLYQFFQCISNVFSMYF